MKALAAITLAMVLAATAGAAEVRLSSRAAVDSRVVTVGDVAEVTAADAAERERVSRVQVAVMAEGDSSVRVDAETVKRSLAIAGVNLAAVSVSGATATSVERARKAGGAASWAGAIERYLSGVDAAARFAVSDVRADFEPGVDLDAVVTASDAVQDAVQDTGEAIVAFVVVDAKDLSKPLGRFYARVEKRVPAVVAAKRLFAGRTVSPEDLEMSYLAPAEAEGAAASIDECLGRRVLYSISRGAAMRVSYLQGREIVKRGDTVVLEISSGAMTVSVKTTALESACLEDVARLRRQGSRVEYLAKITGPGRAIPATQGGV